LLTHAAIAGRSANFTEGIKALQLANVVVIKFVSLHATTAMLIGVAQITVRIIANTLTRVINNSEPILANTASVLRRTNVAIFIITIKLTYTAHRFVTVCA